MRISHPWMNVWEFVQKVQGIWLWGNLNPALRSGFPTLGLAQSRGMVSWDPRAPLQAELTGPPMDPRHTHPTPAMASFLTLQSGGFGSYTDKEAGNMGHLEGNHWILCPRLLRPRK